MLKAEEITQDIVNYCVGLRSAQKYEEKLARAGARAKIKNHDNKDMFRYIERNKDGAVKGHKMIWKHWPLIQKIVPIETFPEIKYSPFHPDGSPIECSGCYANLISKDPEGIETPHDEFLLNPLYNERDMENFNTHFGIRLTPDLYPVYVFSHELRHMWQTRVGLLSVLRENKAIIFNNRVVGNLNTDHQKADIAHYHKPHEIDANTAAVEVLTTIAPELMRGVNITPALT